MRSALIRLVILGLTLNVLIVAVGAVQRAGADKLPTIAGQPIDPKQYKGLMDAGYLPLRPELTDLELADKLDLKLPQLSAVKAAIDKKDAKALKKALAEYLDRKKLPSPTESAWPSSSSTSWPKT